MQKIFKLILLLIFLTITISSNAFEKISKVDEISKILDVLFVRDNQFMISNRNLFKREVFDFRKIKSGNSEDEIYIFLKSKYGDWIVYEPEFNKYTLILWILPLFLFIFGGLLIVRKVFISSL